MLNYWLIAHNIICIIFFLTCSGIGILVYIKNPKKNLNKIFCALNISVACFYLFHFLGVNASSEASATLFFGSNWINILGSLFTAHLFFETLGLSQKHRKGLWVIYGSSIALILLFIVRPDLMISGAEPKFHMPFYYVPGPWYLIMRLQNLVVITYATIILLRAYSKAQLDEKLRLNYLIYADLYAFTLIAFTMLPIYDINFPPALTMLFGAYTLIFAYGIFKYEMFNITIVAKKALFYGLIVTSISFIIIGINTASSYVTANVPNFPIWVIPLISGLIATIIGVVIWKKIKEVDILKYEFISVVTHKFRTPLTAIKWSVNMLREPATTKADRDVALEGIEQSEQKLVELLEVIMDTYHSGNNQYEYVMHTTDLREIVRETLKTQNPMAEKRKIRISLLLPDRPLSVHVDKNKIKFVMQTLIENAINYSRDGSVISIKGAIESGTVVCAIEDKGIGIAKEDLGKIFSKFYRGNVARAKDTEGMGVGLNLAHSIAIRHGGDITVESNGVNTGATFTVKLPLRK
ncbi:MAG: ATP-binding protein [Patescibacteria group bacterium]